MKTFEEYEEIAREEIAGKSDLTLEEIAVLLCVNAQAICDIRETLEKKEKETDLKSLEKRIKELEEGCDDDFCSSCR